jgi:hypothetical protein
MPIFKKHKSSTSTRRAIAVTCFLLLAFLVIIYKSRFQLLRLIPPQQRSSTTGDTSYSKKSKLQESDRQFLIAQGLGDPANDLVRDLMNHNELIPCKGTLGGTPGFYDPAGIAILDKNHVKAVFEDGHEEGTIELAFTVAKGKITWKVMHANCGN